MSDPGQEAVRAQLEAMKEFREQFGRDIPDGSSPDQDQIMGGMSEPPQPVDPFSKLPQDGKAYEPTYQYNWRYEQRREAQEIIPHLYLGPYQSSNKLEVLLGMGITHVLCVRDKREASLVYPRFPDRFQYLTLEIADRDDTNIISIFPICKDFIENALNNGGTVLVHCNGGLSTSPALVIGYIMWKYGMSYADTLNYVQHKRYCISPSSFSVQLREYEPITIAQKMIEAAGGYNVANRQHKRVNEDADEEDGYMRKIPSFQ